MSMHHHLFIASGLMIVVHTGVATAAEAPATLADAAERQDRAAVHALLQDGARPDAAQADGTTALHWAVYYDDLELVRRLVDERADVNAANRYGVVPLSLACTNGNMEIVELLLVRGANPNATLRGGETALMTAARTGRIGPVRSLVSFGVDVDAKERSGQTAMMWAAAEGHAEVVQELLRAGADWRTPLESGFTPFFFAVREGHADVVKLLLDAGIDVNETMQRRRSFERAPSKGTSPLILAIENGHFELAVILLEAGADPNDQRSGYTPLQTLTWVRKTNRGDGPDGDPPPRGSGQLDSLDFARRLVAHGADVNARVERGTAGRGRLNTTGATAFLLAAKTADVPLLRLLLELGADPQLANVDRCPPLLACAGVGTLAPGEEAGTEAEAVAAVELILDLGADINAVDDNGETAVHGAAYKNLPRMVELLARRGARIEVWNQKNRYGWTPLAIAEGHRVGNFKPSPETIAAIQHAMLAAGVTPPPPSPRTTDREGY
jgi:ankyrin repeat protein